MYDEDHSDDGEDGTTFDALTTLAQKAETARTSSGLPPIPRLQSWPHSSAGARGRTTTQPQRERSAPPSMTRNPALGTKGYLKAACSALTMLSPYQGGPLYRRTDLKPEYLAGYEASLETKLPKLEHAFTSTTTVVKDTCEYKGNNFPAFFVIHGGKLGKSLQPISQYPDDHEVLFPPQTSFQVDKMNAGVVAVDRLRPSDRDRRRNDRDRRSLGLRGQLTAHNDQIKSRGQGWPLVKNHARQWKRTGRIPRCSLGAAFCVGENARLHSRLQVRWLSELLEAINAAASSIAPLRAIDDRGRTFRWSSPLDAIANISAAASAESARRSLRERCPSHSNQNSPSPSSKNRSSRQYP